MAVKTPGEIEATGGEPTIPQVVPKSGITTAPPKDEPKPVTTVTPVTRDVITPTPAARERTRRDVLRNVEERESVLGRNRSRVVRSWFWNGVEHHELQDGSVAKSTSTGRTLRLSETATSTALRLRPTVVAFNRGDNPVQGIGDETRKSALSFVKDLGIEAATLFIPGVWVKDWNKLSNRQRALNIAMDLIIFIPIVGLTARISTRASKAVIKSAIRAGSNAAEAAKVGRALNKIENGIILGDGQAIREATVIIRESARKSKINLDRITREVNRKADDIARAGSKPKGDPPPDIKRNLKEQQKVIKKVDDATKDIGSGGKPIVADKPPTRRTVRTNGGNGAGTASKKAFDKGSSVAIAEAAGEARKAASLREILRETRPLRVSRIRPSAKPRKRGKPKTKDRKRIRKVAAVPRAAPKGGLKPKVGTKARPAPQQAAQRRVAPLPRVTPATEAQAQEQPQPEKAFPGPKAPPAVGTATGVTTATGVGTKIEADTGLGGIVGTPTVPTKIPTPAPTKPKPKAPPIILPDDSERVKKFDVSFNLREGTFARKVIYRQGAFWVTLTLDGSDPIFTRTKPARARTGKTPQQTFVVTELSARRPTQKMFDQGRSTVTVTGRGITFRGN